MISVKFCMSASPSHSGHYNAWHKLVHRPAILGIQQYKIKILFKIKSKSIPDSHWGHISSAYWGCIGHH